MIYAGIWQAGRTPWMFSSGGTGSGIFKTTDGGDHWTELTRNPGLPAGLWGNIGVTVSRGELERLWAQIEADSGGVYRSDDAGATWRASTAIAVCVSARGTTPRSTPTRRTRISSTRRNVSFMKSTDGGKTFRACAACRTATTHDLWIDRTNPNRMIESNDGGANVSYDGGRTWSDETSRRRSSITSSTTTHFPYRICGAQQDNSSCAGRAAGWH